MKFINKIKEYKELIVIKKRVIKRLDEIDYSKVKHTFINRAIKTANRYKLALRKLSNS